MPVEPLIARELKRQVAAELYEQGAGAADEATRRQRGRALIEEAVARWSDAFAVANGVSPTREDDRALAETVYDLLFRAGRLQPYLDDPEVENILVNGCDDVWVSRAHQPLQRVPPIADSDEELVELLQDLARRHGGGERGLSTSSPTLALRLEGGMRLQAMTGVTPRPYVAVRRHRVVQATLGDMVALGTVDSTLAAFLASAIRARKNVMITGTQGVGKTSLLRAMAGEIPPEERVGTLETEFELWLHELGHLRQVVPMEGREGNGERVDGRVAGELTIGELIPAALRMTLSRIIVGEVRSAEVVPMLRVMTNGEGGSMCTLHARTPHMVVDRIAELCLEYGSQITDQLAYRLTANALDFIVHVSMIDETGVGGRRHRFVSHVLEVIGLGEHGRPALNTVFGPALDQGEPRAVPRVPPACLDDLRRAGFDADLLDNPYGTWGSPLQLRVGVGPLPSSARPVGFGPTGYGGPVSGRSGPGGPAYGQQPGPGGRPAATPPPYAPPPYAPPPYVPPPQQQQRPQPQPAASGASGATGVPGFGPAAFGPMHPAAPHPAAPYPTAPPQARRPAPAAQVPATVGAANQGPVNGAGTNGTSPVPGTIGSTPTPGVPDWTVNGMRVVVNGLGNRPPQSTAPGSPGPGAGSGPGAASGSDRRSGTASGQHPLPPGWFGPPPAPAPAPGPDPAPPPDSWTLAQPLPPAPAPAPAPSRPDDLGGGTGSGARPQPEGPEGGAPAW